MNLTKRKYFVTIASPNPNKNIPRLIKTIKDNFYQSDFKFVFIGDKSSITFSKYDLGQLPSNVIFLGRVDNSLIKILLQNAKALIYPSLYEGFGLPLMEAMCCKCPIICSDIPPFREICREAAIFFNPTDYDEMFKSINKCIKNDFLVKENIKYYEKLLLLYKWDKSAELILKNCEEFFLNKNSKS